AELAYGIIVLASDAGCATPYDSPACFVASLAAVDSYPIVNWAFDTAVPATGDLVPGSPYLNNLNNNSEPFTRVGIAGHSNKRWVLMRWGGDHVCNPEDGLCGGRAVASYTQFAYDFVLAEAYLALACGDIEDYFYWIQIANDMDSIDSFWNNISAGPYNTDAVVKGPSQAYAGATANYVISNADSHAAVTKSDKDRSELEQVLDNQFHVPRLGTTCTYSISPASASIPATGGNG